MLATILKSPKAVETTIAIVEAYAKLKELSRVIVEIPQQEDNEQVQKTLLQRGGQLVEGIMSAWSFCYFSIKRKVTEKAFSKMEVPVERLGVASDTDM